MLLKENFNRLIALCLSYFQRQTDFALPVVKREFESDVHQQYDKF